MPPPTSRPTPIGTQDLKGTTPPATESHRKPQTRQSTATVRAEQTSLIRSLPRRPNRSVRAPTETLSTESRLTAERSGIGSSAGSRTTSLASPRIVVVQGATRALLSRGMAASLDRTTTGRREISGSSHHHTSPLRGRSIKKRKLLLGRTVGRPTRRARQVGESRTRHISNRSRPFDVWRPTRQGLRRSAPRHSRLIATPARGQ